MAGFKLLKGIALFIVLWMVAILMLMPAPAEGDTVYDVGLLGVATRTVITESEEDLTIEKFKCEFDPPLKHITLIMHYYTDYAELNLEHMTLTGDEEEIWGWSNCIWQPEDDWAACDVYLKIPDTVEDLDGDYAIETAGHENWHAACGDFHE